MASTHTPRRARAVAALVAAVAFAPAAFADEGNLHSLRLSGYGTLGIASVHGTDGWRFRREIIQPADSGSLRTDVDTRLGLQANWELDPRLELVGQVLLKRRAPTAPNEEALAWGFASWTPTPDWTLRAGRTSPDLFLLADYRNVGFAYPWARPPLEFYGWMPVSSMDGVDLTRSWDSASGGRWRAKLFAGQTSLTLPYVNGDTRVRGRLTGGVLTRESQGLTFKVSAALSHNHPVNQTGLDEFYTGLQSVAQLPVPPVAQEAAALLANVPRRDFVVHYTALGASWEHGPWQLQAEASRIDGNFSASNGRYAYVSAAYRVKDTLSVYSMASVVQPSTPAETAPDWQATLTPLIGPQLAAQAQALGNFAVESNNGGREHQHTLSLGLRWDFAERAALKLQWDDIRVAANGSGLWYGADASSRRVQVLSTTLDFVF